MESLPEKKFLADVMLGSLARWLRILGYDVFYSNRIKDEEIIARSLIEERLVLTRDHHLARRLRSCLLVQSHHLVEQIREVLQYTGESMKEDRLLTRCIDCNVKLEDVEAQQVASQIPPYVLETQRKFRCCPVCLKVYWGGTHREHILKRLESLL
ncbi:MAG: Mut7-C RNAse domain-containing protein [Acidobacteria bacterium]|nr:Mut7-C RNAse domain-containing protein [Acidobacteriota bacterium]